MRTYPHSKSILEHNRAYLAGGEVPLEDESQLQVLVDQCREVISRIRARAAAVGTSLTLTYLIRRLDQSLHRLEIIVVWLLWVGSHNIIDLRKMFRGIFIVMLNPSLRPRASSVKHRADYY